MLIRFSLINNNVNNNIKMKNLLLLALLIFSVNIFAQVNTPAIGTDYLDQTYYALEDGSMTSNPHTDWDIAFNVTAGSAGVLVNEGTGLSFMTTYPEVGLYFNNATDFATADTTGISKIYNPEVEWSTGAFNSVSSGSPLDLGWGDYNTTTHAINGTRIFFIKLRTDVYKKVEIQSLIAGVYTFRYADLDGSNEVIQTIDKANYTGKTLAYFSIENEIALDLEPTHWDLLFTRYYTDLDNNGISIDYLVTGVLQNNGVEVAQADNITPTTVDYTNYTTEYRDTLTIIGHDWKGFDFQLGWVIEANQVFFVKTATDSIWKVQFYDFEGTSTGKTTLEKTFETALVSTSSVYQSLESFNVYPNPVTDHVNIAFELATDNRNAIIEIYNTVGQNVLSQSINVNNGFNIKHLPIDLVSGTYYLTLKVDNEVITKPIFVR